MTPDFCQFPSGLAAASSTDPARAAGAAIAPDIRAHSRLTTGGVSAVATFLLGLVPATALNMTTTVCPAGRAEGTRRQGIQSSSPVPVPRSGIRSRAFEMG